MENNLQDTKGKISGPLLFGLKLRSVEQVCKTISLEKVRPLNNLSSSTKRRKILDISQCILDVVETEKENIFHLSDQVKLKQVKFETCNNLYDVSFGELDRMEEIKKTEAMVKSLDKRHISREAYRSLTQVDPNLPREWAISNTRKLINIEM